MRRYAAIPYRIDLAHPLRTGKGKIRRRSGWWLLAQDEVGRVGIGEIAPLPRFGTESHEEADRFLRRFLARSGAGILASTAEREAHPAFFAGYDLSLLDLEGRIEGRGIASLLCRSPKRKVRCHRLIPALEPEAAAEEAARAVAMGYRTLKLKIGAQPIEGDRDRLAAVRERIGPGVSLRLDANRAYDPATAIDALRRFHPYDIEFVEEPAGEEFAEIARRSGVRIAADESAATYETAMATIREATAAVIMIKPMAFGRLSQSRTVAESAIEMGIEPVVTSILDTPIGIAGALHLAASLPLETACGLATADLLSPTPIYGLPRPRQGHLTLPAGPGLGVRLDRSILEEAFS